MTASTSLSPETKPAPDYSTWALTDLINEHYAIKNEMTEIDCNHWETWAGNPVIEREYKALRKPLETRLEAVRDALEPYYRAQCRIEQRERLFTVRGAS